MKRLGILNVFVSTVCCCSKAVKLGVDGWICVFYGKLGGKIQDLKQIIKMSKIFLFSSSFAGVHM